MRTLLALSLALTLSLTLTAASAHASPPPHIRSLTTIAKADGARLELTTRFQAPERRRVTLNEVAIEVETIPPEPIQPGETIPPEPIRYRVEGRALTGPGEAEPCVMPALFLLTKGYVSGRQIFDALGLNVEVTQVRGDAASVQDRATDASVLGVMLAQVAALRPDRAPLVAQLMAAAGFAPADCAPSTRQ